ncbi:TniB family NTP-binding protein [Acidovorax sp. A1169]|nr:TniB family NTP-binding protein [Acidovorax sp. A1169]
MCGYSDAQRLSFLDEPRWIGYPKAQFILDTLIGLMNKPKRPRMPNLLLVGDSNNGKTTIISRFEQLCGSGFIDEESEAVRPIVVAESPPNADEKGLYVSILSQFWTPFRASDTVTSLRHTAITKLRACKAKVLVIDELHSLLSGPPAKQRQVMNSIKMLCNELRIPVVGVGTRDAVRVLHTDPQHASRFDVVSLSKWELNEDFQRLLAGFELVLPLKLKSDLAEPELATAMHSICDGNLGDLNRLLVECAKKAISTGTEKITMEIVQSKQWVRPTKGLRELQE